MSYIRSVQTLIFASPGNQFVASLVRNEVDTFVEIYSKAALLLFHHFMIRYLVYLKYDSLLRLCKMVLFTTQVL